MLSNQRQGENSSHNAAVVIPVYNRATVMRATLESVRKQRIAPSELVIVDDGSADGSADAAEHWIAEARPRFPARVIRAGHGGAAHARQIGLEAIGAAPFVAFLDSDDCWPADFLSRAIRALASNPHAVAASCDRRFFNGQGTVISADNLAEFCNDPIPWMFRHGAGVLSSTLIRTSAVREAGGWNKAAWIDSAEDTWTLSQIAVLGAWLHLPGTPCDFNWGNASACGEEGNLNTRYADRFLRWARVHEQIYERLSEKLSGSRLNRLRGPLADLWRRAGKQQEHLGNWQEAQRCYRQSCRWKPIQLRSWLRRMWCALSGRKAG